MPAGLDRTAAARSRGPRAPRRVGPAPGAGARVGDPSPLRRNEAAGDRGSRSSSSRHTAAARRTRCGEHAAPSTTNISIRAPSSASLTADRSRLLRDCPRDTSYAHARADSVRRRHRGAGGLPVAIRRRRERSETRATARAQSASRLAAGTVDHASSLIPRHPLLRRPRRISKYSTAPAPTAER